jgi:hypothetical protein
MAATLDDVLNELQRMVNLQQVAVTMAQASASIRAAGGAGAVNAAGGIPGGNIFTRYLGQTSIAQSYRQSSGYFGRLMGGSGGSGLEGLGGFAGGAAKLAGGVTAVVGALNSFRKAVENTTTSQLEGYRRMAEVSGGMAAVMANRDLQETLRNMRQGEAQSESAGRLAEAEQRRKDAAEPLDNAFSNLKNDLLAGMNDLLADFYDWGIDRMNDLFEAIPDWIDKGYKIAKSGGATGDGALGTFAKGLEAQAKKLEDDAKAAMDEARRKAERGGLGGSAARPGRLP